MIREFAGIPACFRLRADRRGAKIDAQSNEARVGACDPAQRASKRPSALPDRKPAAHSTGAPASFPFHNSDGIRERS